jgi:hypothetical protein
MINEPRTYRHSLWQLGLVILIFGILGLGLLTNVNDADFLLIPFGGFLVIVFLTIIYSLTTKTTISDSEISTQTLFGTKSLGWSEISSVSGRGYKIKLNNSDGDVTVGINPQLPGYEEIIDWIGIKRPDLFSSQEYSEMKRNWASGILFPIIGLIIIGAGLFLMFQMNTDDSLFIFAIFFIMGIVFLVIPFSTPQSLIFDGNSLLIKYWLSQKNISADEVQAVELRSQRTRNGKVFFILLHLVNKKSVKISGLTPSLPVAYLVLKNWHKKTLTIINTYL